MADGVMQKQSEGIRVLAGAQGMVLELSFDETECAGRLGKVASSTDAYSLMMLHAVVSLVFDTGRTLVEDTILAPPHVINTTANVLASALLQCLALPLADAKNKCIRLLIVIVSDSAKACLKVGRHFLSQTSIHSDFDGVVCVHIVCQMHQTQLCAASAFKSLHVINCMFCASLLV